MRHDNLNHPIATLSPQEAVTLGNLRTVADFRIVEKIHNYFHSKKQTLLYRMPGILYRKTISAVWNAGRIEGIRAERKRRKHGHRRYEEGASNNG